MFAMGGLQAEAANDREPDEPKPVPPSNDDKLTPDQQTRPAQTIHHFNVPAGTLAEVAAAIEKETGLKLKVAARVAGQPSPGVKGVLTAEEAFEAALKDTGVSAQFDSPDHVSLDLRGSGERVTVTASAELPSLKYTAPLRDLPQTLTIIPEAVLQNTASTSLVDALRTVSGITFGAGEGGNPVGDRPFIRGVDAQSSTFVDNLRDIGSQSRETFDIESVEVAKGPSGGYAGRGASGGSININSKMARKDRFATVSFSPATARFFRGSVDGNMKLTNWASGRLSGMAQDSNMAGRDQVHANRYGAAPAFLFNIGHRTRIFTNYYDLRSNDLQDPGIPYNNPTFFARTDGRARVYQTGDGQPLLVNRNAFYGLASRDFRYEKVKTTFGRVEVDLKEGIVLRNSYRYGKSNQDYVNSNADDSQGNIYYGLVYRRALNRNTAVDTSINQTDLAGHVKTGSITHNFATGFEFARERSWNGTNAVAVPNYTEAGNTTTVVSASRCPKGIGAAGGYFCTDLLNPSATYGDPWQGVVSTSAAVATVGGVPTFSFSPFTNGIVKSVNPTKQRTITGSLYGFDTIQFLPQLQATVGIRYDHYNSSYRNLITCVATALVPCTFNTISDLVNYQVGVVYKPLKAASIYGSVSSSATPPGNALSQGSDGSAITSIVNQALPPEKTRSEEAGVKWEVGAAKALVTAAWFQQDTDNVRITQADGSISAVGKRRNRGLDTGISGYLTSKWQVFGGYTYMSAILLEAGGAGTAAGLMNGRRFPNTPEHSFAMTSYYQATRKLSVGGGVYATGKVFGNDSPTAPKWVGAYGRVDLFGSYHFNKHVDLQANLQNLGDKAYFLQAFTTHFAQLAPGRQGRATLVYHF
jgi:catecholate siderophore receptor